MSNLFKKTTILIITLAIFMAPVSALIQVNKNNNLALKFETKKAFAENTDSNLIITPKDTSVIIDTTIDPSILESDVNYTLSIFLYDGDKIPNKESLPPDSVNFLKVESQDKINKISMADKTKSTISKTFQNLTPKKNYYLLITITEDSLLKDFLSFIYKTPNALVIPANLAKVIFNVDVSKKEIPLRTTKTFTTNSDISTNDGAVGATIDQTPTDFSCSITNLGGCVLQVFYVLWVASSLIAQLAGNFLDFFIYYATNSSSYSNTFVEQAWAAVRDIANIFFIIALFYVAVKTILGLNVTDNKKLVGMVIVIGLVINFSLFTTKIVIDSSNILAKVFYNNITSTNEKTQQNAVGAGGQKSISVGLVDKFNPQNIVMKAYKSGLGIGYCIFIILLLMAITLYTAYIFFSVAFLFVARVVSLWISMIFSPLAFASYTVPFPIPGFGHKEWWSDLFKNAFLAPLFVFMLYIIVLFAGFLNEIAKYNSDSSWTERLLTIVVPFIILMGLLDKSKKLAVQYSGEMGQAIKGIGGAIAGIAVGGAALTTAFAGRSLIGRTTAAAARSDSADRYAKYKAGTLPAGTNLNFKDKTIGRLGYKINKTQKDVERVDHARHEIETYKEKAGLKGIDNNFISGAQNEKLQKVYTKDKRSEIESDLRTGRADLIDQTGTNLGKIGEEGYKSQNRHIETLNYMTSNGIPLTNINQLTKQDDKNIENNLNKKFNEVLKISLDKEAIKKLEELQHHAKETVSIGQRLTSKSTGGSYDIRNFTTKMHENDTKGFAGLSNKALAGLTGAVALGIRSGMKIGKAGLGTSSFGTPQKDIYKDIGNTITEALKGVKIDVKIGDGGGHGGGGHGGGHDAHGGGHGGGGHGGGHH